MKICVLTYQCIHRKTYDTLSLLKALGYNDVLVYGTPLKYTKKFRPIIEHRPENTLISDLNITWDKIVSNFGYKAISINDYEEINLDKDVVFLVCGAGILPEWFIKRYKVINSHPGYIPYARGLDALKWAILEGMPIGATSHFIGDYIDSGEVIERKEVPIFENDTFHALARRVYETEINLLVNAISHINDTHEFYGNEGFVHKRMPNDVEALLLDKFEEMKTFRKHNG